MRANRAVIFANGEISDDSRLLSFLLPEDTCIAVDGGLRHIWRLGLTPTALVGDLDSLAPQDVARARQQGAAVVRFPPAKDATDLELAIEYALAEGFSRIRLAGMLGGRVDHLLGNLGLMALPALAGLDVRIEEGNLEIFVIRDSATINGQVGERVSLLALHGEARGITTQGLEYPLAGETLYPERARGISNVLTTAIASVQVEHGLLWCIHFREVTYK